MSPSQTIRVGLLICGTLTGSIETAHGDYLQVYTHYWRSTTPPNLEAKLVLDEYYIKKLEFPNEEQISETDMLMVTGSATSAYDDTIEWVRELNIFLRRVINDHPKVKIAGICFGHQIVARALGGECVLNSQWEIGPTSIDLTDFGKSILGVDRLSLQQMHRDHVPVESLSKEFDSGELQLIGYTGVTGNQGFVKFYPAPSGQDEPGVLRPARDIHIMCVQGHPEFSESLVTAIVQQRAESGVMDSATVIDYWGAKGGDYDNEPEDKTGTGRRWQKTDGLDVIANVLWRMVSVSSQ